MIVYVNSKYEIKDVETTTDHSLTAIEIPDGVFGNRTVTEICCYKLIMTNGRYNGFTPYINAKIIGQIKKLADKNAELEEQNRTLSMTVDGILTDIIPSLFG